MNRIILAPIVGLVLILGCAQIAQKEEVNQQETIKKSNFQLEDFLTDNVYLDAKVDSVFNTLDDKQKIAQLLMPAIGRYGQTEAVINGLTKDGLIGGVLLLNGTKQQFTSWVDSLDQIGLAHNYLPFLYSADAEPSLVNRKIIGSTPVKKANEIKTIEEVEIVANQISDELNAIGINYNFAPVVDMSKNSTVGYRGFGAVESNIIPWSNAFIRETQAKNIMATAKHFPGHGLVSGDTHKSLQMINGELKEIKNYPPLIEAGVLSIMIAHIAVTNNEEFDTKGMPATTSSKIVTELLRDSLGFKGLIVTDAMNMGGVVNVPNGDVKTIQAGCDIILMPVDARLTHGKLMKEYQASPAFKSKVDLAAKRVIRSKICLGLIP